MAQRSPAGASAAGIERPEPVERSRSAGRGTWLILGVAALLLALAGLMAYYRFVHAQRIFPGVSVGTIDVGGLAPAVALQTLTDAGLDPGARVLVHAGREAWSLDPAQVGVALDLRATVAEAYGVGRSGSSAGALLDVLQARAIGTDVSPIVVLNEYQARHTVHALADVFDRPAQNAALAIDGTAVFPVESVTGRALDVKHAVDTIADSIAGGVWPMDELVLPISTITPEVVSAAEAVSAAQALLSSPITIRDGSDSWELPPGTLAPMLTVTNSNGSVILGLDEERLSSWMMPVTETISRSVRLPRFRYEPTYGQLQLLSPGLSQRLVDLPATAQHILAVGGVGPRAVPVAVDEVPPAVPDTATATELGIAGVVEEQTSLFVGSPAERIHNIGIAAGQFNGLLVPPGAVLSFNEAVGDISADTGYEETKIIMDGTTTDGVGGGVCQVSTTLFRTAFYAGLPIEERYPHGYRVAYYEQGAPPGLDATVYNPVVDFKFRNDTGAWILIETETDSAAATTTFRFLGTRPDRQVTLEGPVIGDTTPPPEPRIEVDPLLAPGESKIIEHARNGASVHVTRIITTAGEELREIFASNYRPTGLVTAVGPTLETPTPVTQDQTTDQAGLAAGLIPPLQQLQATPTP